MQDCIDSFDSLVERSCLFDVLDDHIFPILRILEELFREVFPLFLRAHRAPNSESTFDELLGDICERPRERERLEVSGGRMTRFKLESRKQMGDVRAARKPEAPVRST